MAENIIVYDWMFKEVRRDAVLTYAIIYQHTCDGSYYHLDKKYVADWQNISVTELEFILSYLLNVDVIKKSTDNYGEAYTVCEWTYCTRKNKDKPLGPHVKRKDIATDIIEYFNEKCGTNFKTTTNSIIKLVNGRLKEGYSKEDFYKVIDLKFEQWGRTPFRFSNGQPSNTYLRPSTLFGPNNFANYLNEACLTKPEAVGQSIECTEKANLVY